VLYLQPDFASTLPDNQRQFRGLLSLDGEVYRRVDGRKTLRFRHHDKTYFLKAHTGVGWAEILKNLVQGRLPIISACPEWRALHRLKELGIDTMTPVGYGYEGGNPARRRSFLITEDLGETTTLEEVFLNWKGASVLTARDARLKRALIRKVAHIARTMHQNGVNHRDFYLCHLRVQPLPVFAVLPPDEVAVYVMDLHRAQLRRRTPGRWRIKDLAGLYFSSLDLGLTRRDLYRFAKSYSQKPLREIVAAHSGFFGKVEARAVSLYRKIHRKPPAFPCAGT
jgi:hypothetical protein